MSLLLAFFVGPIASSRASYLDEAYGDFNRPMELIRRPGLELVENRGWGRRTVWWRVRAVVPPA